ncbi:MAG: aldo/keto reductase, partial [Sphingobacteriales bacterium]
VESIDLWQLHRIDPNVNVAETLAPVVEAVQEGKIKYVGLSEVTIEQIKQVQDILPIVSVQNLYNLANRQWESVLDFTAEQGLAFIPWFPLASGPHKLEDKIKAIALTHCFRYTQTALFKTDVLQFIAYEHVFIDIGGSNSNTCSFRHKGSLQTVAIGIVHISNCSLARNKNFAWLIQMVIVYYRTLVVIIKEVTIIIIHIMCTIAPGCILKIAQFTIGGTQ